MTSLDAVAKEYFAAFNRRDFQTLTNMLAPNFVFEHVSPVEGRDKAISMLQQFCTAFPDLEFSVTDQITREDEVVCFLRASGTWRGEFAGIPPTGRHFTARVVDRIRFSGASIAYVKTVCEVLGGFSLVHQLGIAAQPCRFQPAPAPAAGQQPGQQVPPAGRATRAARGGGVLGGDEVGFADQRRVRGMSGDDPAVGQVPPLYLPVPEPGVARVD